MEHEAPFFPAVQPEAPQTGPRAPWTIGDILKALVIPGALLLLSVGSTLLAKDDNKNYDATSLTIVFIFGIALELVLVTAVFFLTVRKYGVSWSALGLRNPQWGSWWLPLVLLGSAWGVMLIYFYVLSAAGVDLKADVPSEAYDNVGPVITLALLSLVAAPFAEEIFFRGFVFGGLRSRKGVPFAIVVSGLLFGAAHVGNPDGLLIFVPISLVGMIFAWGYFSSGSLAASMAAHLLFNLISFSAGFM